MTPNINIIDLAEKHGQTSYRNRADTKHPAYGFTEEGLQAFAHALLAAAPQAVQPAVPSISFDFKQAHDLLEMFGGEPGEVIVCVGDGHSGQGMYAVWAADTEGSIYLGVTDDDAAPAHPAEGVPAQAVQLSESRNQRVYVAGPMTGMPDYNFPAFNAAASMLRAKGWHVENPAEHGIVAGATWADYMHYDLARIATCSDIYLLPGWCQSRGAALEVHIASVLGMTFQYADGAERYHPPSATQPAAQGLDAAKLLAKKHTGMKVDYRGLLGQVRRAIKRTAGGHEEMLRQLECHITELGQRWYAGDTDVVDELLQLYCVEREARAALAAQAKQGGA